jgi:thiol-disulfide isomerase/thioredoxin
VNNRTPTRPSIEIRKRRVQYHHNKKGKIMKYASFLLLLIATPVLAYGNLDELLADQQKQEIAALKAYIAEHPDAADAGDAQDRLISDLLAADAKAEALPLMLKRYDALAGKPDADLQPLFGQIVPSVVEIYGETGRKQEARDFIERVRKDFAQHEMAERIGESLDGLAGSLNKPSVGDTMEIAFEALDGRKVDLAAMKGKVVLVDFWATWCGPCKVELPHVKAAYDKHHEAGFEIVGISLDDDKEKLEKFIKDRNVAWPQFFDGNGWQNEIGQKYGIQSIPATFLFGRDGKIAATDLRGEKLDQKVAELLAVSPAN